MKRLIDGGPSSMRDLLASARCFDLRSVNDLAIDVAIELSGSAVRTSEAAPIEDIELDSVFSVAAYRVDLSERAVIPASVTWLEGPDFAVMLATQDAATPFSAGFEPDGAVFVMAFLPFGDEEWSGTSEGLGVMRLADGHATFWRTCHPDDSPTVLDLDNLASNMCCWASAALAILASPVLVRTALPVHKGLARRVSKLRRRGAEIEHTRVTIGGARTASEGLGGQGHPKAYHFCRAHSRRLPSGTYTTVRAHWRGDVAYGVRLPTYEVASAA